MPLECGGATQRLVKIHRHRVLESALEIRPQLRLEMLDGILDW